MPALQQGYHVEGTNMNRKLQQIQNWPERAREAKWSASALAQKCGVSGETLRQHFLKKFNEPPKAWLAAQRNHMAIEILGRASSMKETANIRVCSRICG
jgi:transcriptional regulator GlxA family with amidase domain